MAKYDWQKIELEFRTNKLSNRELSRKYGASEAAIRKRAKEGNWKRDLASKVDRETEERIARAGLELEGKTDQECIEVIANRNVNVVEIHRKDINTGRSICGLMMNELLENTQHNGVLTEIVNGLADQQEWDAKRTQAVQRAISLPQRASTMRDLSGALKNLIALEREAFGIDGKATDRDPLDELLDEISDTSRGVDGYKP